MDNYQFCAEWATRFGRSRIRVLDYGCGAGDIVARMTALGLDASGCDIFYAGGDRSSRILEGVRDRVFRMADGIIPFEDETFDLVVNNQVMEHVVDLDFVLDQIDRVLKPGGVVLSLFPDRGVWREGHCGIPFLHWFAEGSSIRPYYAWIMRSLGLGFHKAGKSRWQWSLEWCAYLDKWTHYRTIDEIERAYGRHFRVKYIEPDWLDRRASRLRFLPAFVKTLIGRKMGNLVFEAHKDAEPIRA